MIAGFTCLPGFCRRLGSGRAGGGLAGAAAEVFADETDGNGALADGRGDPLDRAGSHVAGREYPGQAGLQQVGVPGQLVPGAAPASLLAQIRAGDGEAVTVQLDRLGEPPGVRLGADENQKRRGGQGGPGRGDQVLHDHLLEPASAVKLPDRAVVADLDAGLPGDAVEQVLRHARGQVLTPHDDGDRATPAGQPGRRLTGRVAATDDHNRIPRVDLVVSYQRGVEHPGALELLQASRLELSVGDAGGDDQAPGGQFLASVQPDYVLVLSSRKPGCGGGHQQPGPEPQHLDEGPFGELLAANAHREAQVILDPGGGADLAPNPQPIDRGGGQ